MIKKLLKQLIFSSQTKNLLRVSSKSIFSRQKLIRPNIYKVVSYFSSNQKKDLYNILGIPKTSTKQEIKKAYYKLAQKYHPDKNPDKDSKEKFLEISDAYETLTDDKKRQIYDQTGRVDQQNYETSGADPFSAFSQFWNQRTQGFQGDEDLFGQFQNIFTGGGNPFSAQNLRSKGQDIVRDLNLSFMDAVNGKTISFEYQKYDNCVVCNGTKSKPGSKPKQCPTCKGSGFVNYRQGPMYIKMACQACQGIGTLITDPCNACHGSGVGQKKVSESITIPAGVDNGQFVKLPRKGHKSDSNQVPGDLVIRFNVESHPYFARDGFDIYTEHFLSISQAVLGEDIDVKTLKGQKKIKIRGGVEPGQKITINNEGVQKINGLPGQRGNHYVILKVKIPKSLSDEQKEFFKKLAEIEKKESEVQNTKS